MSLQTELRAAVLQLVQEEGLSYGAAAERLGVTRNQVGGILNRYGGPREGRPIIPREMKTMKTQVRSGSKPKVVKLFTQWLVENTPDKLHAKIPPADVVGPQLPGPRLIDLEYGDCRWPTYPEIRADTTHPEFGLAARYFCGRPAREGASYCEGHARLSVGSGTPGERAIVRAVSNFGARGL